MDISNNVDLKAVDEELDVSTTDKVIDERALALSEYLNVDLCDLDETDEYGWHCYIVNEGIDTGNVYSVLTDSEAWSEAEERVDTLMTESLTEWFNTDYLSYFIYDNYFSEEMYDYIYNELSLEDKDDLLKLAEQYGMDKEYAEEKFNSGSLLYELTSRRQDALLDELGSSVDWFKDEFGLAELEDRIDEDQTCIDTEALKEDVLESSSRSQYIGSGYAEIDLDCKLNGEWLYAYRMN